MLSYEYGWYINDSLTSEVYRNTLLHLRCKNRESCKKVFGGIKKNV